jgi:hypothetical protein
MLPWFHDASSGLTSSVDPWSCKRLHGQALGDPNSETGWRCQTSTWRKGVKFASQAEALLFKSECTHFGTVPLAVFYAYPALCLGFRMGPSRIHCGIPRKPKMQAHCNIVASTLALHGSPGLNSWRPVVILCAAPCRWVSHFRCPFTPKSWCDRQGLGKAGPSGRSRPRCLSNPTIGLERDALRAGCNTPADWRSG